MKKVISGLMLMFCIVSVQLGYCGQEEPLLEGNTIVPLQECNVRLASQHIHVSSNGRAKAIYMLNNNSGAALTCCIGFPISIGEELSDFKLFINGVPAEFKKIRMLSKGELAIDKKKSNLSRDMYVWSVNMLANGNVKVAIEYKTQWGSTWRGMTAPHFIYNIKLATAWPGGVGRSDIFIELDSFVMELLKSSRYKDHGFILYAAPTGYKQTGNMLEWHYTDMPPSENILVMAIETAEFTTGIKQLLKKYLNSFDYDNERLVQGIKSKYRIKKGTVLINCQ